MKEPNIGTPVEDDIRRHFKNLLHPEKEIEIIPHTKVWATVDGVLLWDPKNGYADIGNDKGGNIEAILRTISPDNTIRFRAVNLAPTKSMERKPYPGSDRKPTYMETTNETKVLTASHRSDVTNLKRVVYITGPQGSGKSRLVELMTDAVELNRGQYIGFTDLSRSIDKHASYSTVIICSNDLRPDAFDLNHALAIWCRERKLEYLNINLK